MKKTGDNGGSLQSLDSCCSSTDMESDLLKNSDVGLRSPGALTGCSVKEIDEQLTNLRKENFNLKLRIYFLEERMGSNFNTDKENAIKKNIELMVELENVRKDLDDKQQLLCQAAKAMEIEEEERKKEVGLRDREIALLKAELEELQSRLKSQIQSQEENKQLALCMEAFDLDLGDSNTADLIKKLQNTIKDLQIEMKKEKERADNLDGIMELAESAQMRCKNLELELENKQTRLDNLTIELEETGSKMLSYSERVELLEETLSEKSVELENVLSELKQRDQEVEEHLMEIDDLSKMCQNVQAQSDRHEKKAEKYKMLLMQSESKNHDMILYIDSLKGKIQNLEVRLESALDEVKRTNTISNTETVLSTDQVPQSNNTDIALFSVRDSMPTPETAKPSPAKTPPQINRSPKSVHSKSPIKSASATRLHTASDNFSKDSAETHSRLSTPSTKSSSMSEIPSDVQLSHDELIELKKNHYKACKMIKAMIQRKNEYVQQIEKLQVLIAERDSELQCLRNQITELSENKTQLMRQQSKKTIQELVSELNFTASPDPAANKETSMAADEVHLAEQYKELANELEKKIEILNATLNEKDNQMEQLKIDVQSKANRIIDLEFELLALSQGINRHSPDALGDADGAVEQLLQEKEEKEKEIKRLDGELRQRTCDLQGIVNKELWEKNRAIEKLQTALKSKDQEIERLEKNSYGKELQLNILKDKINELGIHVNLPPGLIAANPRVIPDETVDTQEQLTKYLEERNHLINEIEVLRTQLKNTPERDENKQLSQLKTEYKDLQEELEKSEKLRLESQDICGVLSTRLEELCYFLDSLLKQKSVLGLLGTEQMNKLQRVVDKSLDLSRTLSATMSLNPDQSLLQLSNITNLLNSTRNDSLNLEEFFIQDDENNAIFSIIPSDITLTYQSHLSRSIGCTNDQTEVIKVLREQVSNLKREIELRDVELEKKLTNESKPPENDEEFVDALVELQPAATELSKLNTTSTTLKNQNDGNQSESESWSEPDRTVSMARIGLQDESLKRLSNGNLPNRRGRFAAGSNMSTESTEEERGLLKTSSKRSTLTESRHTIISLHEQVCSLETKLKEKENQLLAAQVAFYEADNLLKQEKTKVNEAKRENAMLIAQVTMATKKLEEVEQKKQEDHIQLIEKITETNAKLEMIENQKLNLEQRICELQQIVSVLEEFRRNAELSMSSKDKEMQNVINELEIEKNKAVTAARHAEELLEHARQDVLATKLELQEAKRHEQQIREKLEQEFQQTLKSTEEQYAHRVESVERDCETQARRCREAVVQIKESYEKEYIKRSEVDEVMKQMENLKSSILECDLKTEEMEKREAEFKCKIEKLERDRLDQIQNLQKELDTAMLQYSEAVLEKSRLQNEISALEQKMQKFYLKETELIKEVSELHKDFQTTKVNLEAQVSQLEHQKSVLDLKISNLETANAELQSTNAELRNRLIKLQVSRNSDMIPSTSLPNNLGAIFDTHINRSLPIAIQQFGSYTRQLSDHSGYTSEEIPTDDSSPKALIKGGVSSFVQSHLHSLMGTADTDQERMHANSSPDLGIESDHGRFSSLEANINVPRPLLPTLELTRSMSNLLDPVQDSNCADDQCCDKTKKMAIENVELRKRLLRTRRALEETLNRLTLANKQKKEVEKSICKQIHKTSQVLRRAKANLDSGSETDLIKK